MDIGVISVRYARALLKSATDAKIEDAVYTEMQQLAKSYVEVPQLRFTIDNPMLSKDKKEALLLTAVGKKPSALTKAFIQLVLKEDREGVMPVHRQFVRHALPPTEECHPRTPHHRCRRLACHRAEDAPDGGE